MSLIDEINSLEDVELKLGVDITKMTTFRLECVADLATVKSVAALSSLLPILKKWRKKYLLIGLGANQILPRKIEDLVINLKFEFTQSELASLKNDYILPASLSLTYLTSAAVKFGLTGWEVFTGIPATLGGAIYMNAGTALGEIGSVVKEVYIMNIDGQVRTHVVDSSSFSYRRNHFLSDGDVIVGAKLFHRGENFAISEKIKSYLEYRKQSQPLATRNCGCVFKNPSPLYQAGRLIDQLGLKGLRNGGLQVSLKHANFIENQTTSNWDQFKDLTEAIKWQMNMFYGIEFELEVKIPYH